MRLKKASAIILAITVIVSVFSFTSCDKSCDHVYSRWSIKEKASCIKEGLRVRTCNNCKYEQTKKIPKTDHIEVNDPEEPSTCTETGKTAGSHCSVCNKPLKVQDEIPALGHDYEEKLIYEPECDSSGLKTFTCKNCSDSYNEEIKPNIYSASEVYELSKKSVGEIITYDKSGSEYAIGTGFAYNDKGGIITNYHVIDGAYSAKITINEKTYPIESVLAYDKDIDIAVLRINATDIIPLSICYKDHTEGNAVYALGSSKGLTGTFSQGIITHSSRESDGVKYVQHDAAISNGNSGGPLINEYCEVIGINTMTIIDSQNLNFAINCNELKNLDFDTPLTLKEVYEKENDAFSQLKDLAIGYGEFDASTYMYTYTLNTDFNDDFTIMMTRYLMYDQEYDITYLSIAITTSAMDYAVILALDESSSTMEWSYYDTEDYTIDGYVYGTSFYGTSLDYYDTNIYDAELLNSCINLSCIMMDNMLAAVSDDFSALGITAQDLGFSNY